MVITFITTMEQRAKANGGLCMETTKESMIICVTNHNENYWEMFVKYKATQGLSKNFNILFFELIDAFMNIKPCFNPHI